MTDNDHTSDAAHSQGLEDAPDSPPERNLLSASMDLREAKTAAGSRTRTTPGGESPQTKPHRETWADWQRRLAPEIPEPARLMTRPDFLAKLNELDLDVDEGTLRSWEYHRVLPRAVRRWNAEAKTSHVYYPPWMIATVLLLRELQRDDSFSLQEIAPVLERATRIFAPHTQGKEQFAALAEERGMPWRDELADPRWATWVVLRVLSELDHRASDPALMTGVRRFEHLTGKTVGRIVVEYRDTNNQPLYVARTIDLALDPIPAGNENTYA